MRLSCLSSLLLPSIILRYRCPNNPDRSCLHCQRYVQNGRFTDVSVRYIQWRSSRKSLPRSITTGPQERRWFSWRVPEILNSTSGHGETTVPSIIAITHSQFFSGTDVLIFLQPWRVYTPPMFRTSLPTFSLFAFFCVTSWIKGPG